MKILSEIKTAVNVWRSSSNKCCLNEVNFVILKQLNANVCIPNETIKLIQNDDGSEKVKRSSLNFHCSNINFSLVKDIAF